MQYNSIYPDDGYPDRLGPWGKFVENSTIITCLEITGYLIKYSTVLWLIDLQIRRGRKVQTQVRTVNSNTRILNYQCSLFSKKNTIIRIICICGWLDVQINPDTLSSTVLKDPEHIFRTLQICHSLPSEMYFLYVIFILV